MTEQKSQPEKKAVSPEPTHLVVTDDVGRYRKGQVVPNAPEIAAELGENARPATQFDLGVAAIVTREV